MVKRINAVAQVRSPNKRVGSERGKARMKDETRIFPPSSFRLHACFSAAPGQLWR